jgi:hypothetical protein
MSNASIGYLAKIQHSATINGTYVDLISEPTMVNVPASEVSRVDCTHLQSPGRTKEYSPGMIDPGAAQYECNYTKADYLKLAGLVAVTQFFRVFSPDVVGNDPLESTFQGYIHNVQLQHQAEELSKIQFEIQTSGASAHV